MTAWEPMADALMSQRYGRLLARARMLAVSDAEAEDLVHDALVATFSKPRGFQSLAQAEQYVRKAIVTGFANAAQRGARERARMAGAAVGVEVPDHASSSAATVDVVNVLATLPPRVRACVALRFLDDLSISETSALLGLTEGAVKRYVHDGLKALNAALGTAESLANDTRVPLAIAREEQP